MHHVVGPDLPGTPPPPSAVDSAPETRWKAIAVTGPSCARVRQRGESSDDRKSKMHALPSAAPQARWSPSGAKVREVNLRVETPTSGRREGGTVVPCLCSAVWRQGGYEHRESSSLRRSTEEYVPSRALLGRPEPVFCL